MGYYNWADRQLRQLMTEDPVYTRSKMPGMRLGLANQLFNGRMAGATDLQNNIFSNQASYQAGITRNATDASSAMSGLAAGLGMTDESLAGLQTKEKENKYSMLQNLNDAYGAMQGEDQMVEQDKVRRYQDKVQLKGAQAANKLAKRKALWNTVTSIANMGISAATGGLIPGVGPNATPKT
jgi:hypothetical protein